MYMLIDMMRTVASSHTKEHDDKDDVTDIHITICLCYSIFALEQRS